MQKIGFDILEIPLEKLQNQCKMCRMPVNGAVVMLVRRLHSIANGS